LLKCLAAPETNEDSETGWTVDDDMGLASLKNDAIGFKDAALAVALKQQANAIKKNIAHLENDQAAILLEALQKRSISSIAEDNQRSLLQIIGRK